jgi:LPS-assembly protein
MFVKKPSHVIYIIASICFIPLLARSQSSTGHTYANLTKEAIAKQLGWSKNPNNSCGGQFNTIPFKITNRSNDDESIQMITEDTVKYSLSSTSQLKKITIRRQDQELSANTGYLYRDPKTGKLTSVALIGDVRLHDNTHSLVIADSGEMDFLTKVKIMHNILYHKNLTTLQNVPITAWGSALQFKQPQASVIELKQATYSTCPPTNPTWQVSAKEITLDKQNGRGTAKSASLRIKNIPILYLPYLSFSTDKQRKSGFLWPQIGERTGKGTWGPYLLAPYYWNMAPNYDMTITHGYLSKRGLQLSDSFRYLNLYSHGSASFSILPDDRAFNSFKKSAASALANGDYGDINNPTVLPILLAENNRLQKATDTRKAVFWQDDTQFNQHWSSHIDINYVSDDYYLRDFGSAFDINEITQNQLLQETDLFYKSEHWNFTGRIQGYQTLHPLTDQPIENQYRRLPQLILDGSYPDQRYGLTYFIYNEATHFNILKDPGSNTLQPIGNRYHMQPGISLPYYTPYMTLTPRIQVALSQYQLTQVNDTKTPTTLARSIPIFDITSTLAFSRDVTWLQQPYQQTLEPQVYYVFVPYRNQSQIPTFDTTTNTLTYDQLFTYNRFTGIDRIGDTSQISLGLTSRFINQASGEEKIRLGVGDIIYFKNRRVTLCNDNSCLDNPQNPDNNQRLSPLSSFFEYKVNSLWKFTANGIWNIPSKKLNNSSLNFHYQQDNNHIVNIGYQFANNADILSGIQSTNNANNLHITDFSFVWPMTRDVSAIGLYSRDWNKGHFQNLLYGVQYDTCCFAVQFVGGRTFTNMKPDSSYQYNNEFYIQVSLKGIGNINAGNAASLLKSISGYKSNI